MIRFKTIEPAEQAKLAEKPVAPAAVVRPAAPEAAEDEAPPAASKSLARKTPLRAKKADAARLFRD
jgi:hypothetical protein